MTAITLDSPGEIIRRLEDLEKDLAARQPALEAAARAWFLEKRDREHRFATEFLRAEGSVEQRKQYATIVTSHVGVEAEAEYEALRAVVRVLETRASVLQSLAKVGR